MRLIQTLAVKQPSAQTLGDLGLVECIQGRPGAAVGAFEGALTYSPGNASLLSDLAAAYMARAGNGLHPYDLVRALAKADQAIQIDPGLQEARFNRALALEKLPLEGEAHRAWLDVLARERDADWKAEEEERRRKLERPTAMAQWERARVGLEQAALRGDEKGVSAAVDPFPQMARLYAEEQLLADWADGMSDGGTEKAERSLSIARAIGIALQRRGGDTMVADAVAIIDAARASPSPQRLQHLIAGHRSFGRGLRLYQERDVRRALPELATARQELGMGGSPFADWAVLYLASCDYFRARFDETLATLHGLEARLPQARYPSLRGQIDWIVGSIAALRGRPGEALPRFLQGRDLFARTGEIEHLSGLLQQTALALGAMGSTAEAWENLHAALRLTPRLQSPRRMSGVFDQAGLACERELPGVALYFQDASLSLSLRLDDPEMIAAARLRRARTLSRLSRTAAARRELAEARRITSRIPEEVIRRRVAAEILSAEAELSLARDPRSALASLNEAISFYERSGYNLFYPLAYFLRGRAWLGTGREEPAERDFLAGLGAIETARESVLEPRMRIAVQDQAAALYAETLAFLSDRNDEDAAFQVSERGHARQLLETMAVASFHQDAPQRSYDLPLSRPEIQESLPPGTALVKYAALEHELLVWVLRHGRSSFWKVDVGQAELAEQVKRILTGLYAGGDRDSLPELRQLYRWLMPPRTVLAGATEIVFVPDGSLGLLPFAALVDPVTRHYLVEDFAIGVSPSASVYAQCLRRSHLQEKHSPASVLAVGAEAFDRKRFPSLPSIHNVITEAAEVAALYPRPILLTGESANRSRFLEGLRQNPDVVHFAGHGLLNPSFPELSMLLFVPEPGKSDSGAVYSHEVQGLRLIRTRLVVLSACETGTGRLSASEGPLGLARPFLAAGAPAVLATLGPVNDAESREILVLFHRRLRAGQSALEALRSAQIARIAAGSGPGRWGLYEIVGAATPVPFH